MKVHLRKPQRRRPEFGLEVYRAGQTYCNMPTVPDKYLVTEDPKKVTCQKCLKGLPFFKRPKPAGQSKKQKSEKDRA